MGIKCSITNLENGEIVELTEHTIENIEEKEHRIDSNSILLSKTVDDLLIEGRLNFNDDSEEILNICKVSEWVKIMPYEKGS